MSLSDGAHRRSANDIRRGEGRSHGIEKTVGEQRPLATAEFFFSGMGEGVGARGKDPVIPKGA